jgi:rod shape-determining protein MreD
MMTKEPRFPGAMLATLLIAIILTIIPVGDKLEFWRPEWIALTLIHWALVIHDRTSLVLAFIIGLTIDTLYGSILGQHALGFVLITYMSVRLGLRMNPESFLQQSALISVVLFLFMLINLWSQGMAATMQQSGWLYWAPLLSSIIIWPAYHTLLNYFHVQRTALG